MCPKFHGDIFCNNIVDNVEIGIIMSDKMDADLSAKLRLPIDDEALNNFTKRMVLFNKEELFHTDLASGNVLVKLNQEGDKIIDIFLTDFGKVRERRASAILEATNSLENYEGNVILRDMDITRDQVGDMPELFDFHVLIYLAYKNGRYDILKYLKNNFGFPIEDILPGFR